MNQINCLSLQLLQEGWTKEQPPPGCRPWKDYYGGWEFDNAELASMTFETPCGLLVGGAHWISGHMSYMGMDWTPENGQPTITCPHFSWDPCPLNHPLLRDHQVSSREPLTFCACHRTARPYTYEGSVDQAHDQVWAEADQRFEAFDYKKGGRACKMHCSYNRATRQWTMTYDPRACARFGVCRSRCKVLQTDLSEKKANVFYDLKTTCVVPGEGLIPAQTRVRVDKGIKLLEKPVSITICEAIVKYGRHRVLADYRLSRHHELFYDPTVKFELLNFGAARMEVRDLQQDLQDVRDGIEVHHKSDELRAITLQKQQRRKASKTKKHAKLERLILADGPNLERHVLERTIRQLGGERVSALLEQWAAPPTEPEFQQLSLI